MTHVNQSMIFKLRSPTGTIAQGINTKVLILCDVACSTQGITISYYRSNLLWYIDENDSTPSGAASVYQHDGISSAPYPDNAAPAQKGL